MIASEQSVIAQIHNENSYIDGDADAAMYPGQGVDVYKDANGDWQVKLVGANSRSKRVVREQRNPPRSLGSVGDSPLDEQYAADDNVETVGMHRYDRARLRLSANASADPTDAEVAWDENGKITDAAGTVDGTNAPDTFIGRGVEVITRSGEDDLIIVEFY